MASIRRRERRDGTVAYSVRFTVNGEETCDTLPDLKSAEKYRDMVNAVGGAKAREMAGFSAPQRATKASRIGLTVEEWLKRYIEGRRQTGIAKSTLWDYESYLRNDIAPVLGPIPLTKLSRDDIEHWVGWLRREQTRGDDAKWRASGKTVSNKHGFLSAALARAVEDGEIVANPAASTHLPNTEKEEMVFLTAADFSALLAEIPEPWKPLVEFLVATGARFGEVSALRPSDVNRKTNTVGITRAWKRTYAVGGYELGPPKTKRSRRRISVAKTILDKLDYTGEWLFTNSGANPGFKGGPVRIANFRANVWNPAIERAGLDPKPRIHDLRHTHASWLIQAGKPLPVIQRRLGHENISTTVDTYGHLDSSDDAAAADVVGDLLSG